MVETVETTCGEALVPTTFMEVLVTILLAAKRMEQSIGYISKVTNLLTTGFMIVMV